MAVTRLPARSPLTPDEIAAIRAPFRKATLLPARAYHDESIYAWETEAATPDLRTFMGDWFDHHAGFGRDMSLWPNLIVSVHPDYVLTHQAWPDGPNRSTAHCELYVEAAQLGQVEVSGAVEFWDFTNREDYHVVEMQHQGTRSRSWSAGRYSNQEASVHALDLMVADRYAMDGVRTGRGWRREVEGAEEKRLRARAKTGGEGVTTVSVPLPPTPADEEERGQ